MDDLGGKVVDGLYVGSLEDARKAVGTGGVTHVLSVCSDKLECAERDVATHQVELLDVEEADLLGVLPECLDWIDAAIKVRAGGEGGGTAPTLVCCCVAARSSVCPLQRRSLSQHRRRRRLPHADAAG